jgi:hypothetical protein
MNIGAEFPRKSVAINSWSPGCGCRPFLGVVFVFSPLTAALVGKLVWDL